MINWPLANENPSKQFNTYLKIIKIQLICKIVNLDFIKKNTNQSYIIILDLRNFLIAIHSCIFIIYN